jgi:nicotinamide phosphoribosyltransferase
MSPINICLIMLAICTVILVSIILFKKYAELTGTPIEFIRFQGHDFSYRGMPGRHAAMMSGGGHLLSFYGTDTIPAIKWLKKYYGAQVTPKNPIIGCSVFATEHAVMCVCTGFYIRKRNLTWEKYGEAEFEVFKRLITELYPTGIVSIVSDTWDLWKVLTEYLPKLKSEILARNGKVVIRPDSGDPVDILCGVEVCRSDEDDQLYRDQDVYETYPNDDVWIKHKYGAKPVTKEVRKGVIELLWDVFGGTINEKGYKVLDPHSWSNIW